MFFQVSSTGIGLEKNQTQVRIHFTGIRYWREGWLRIGLQSPVSEGVHPLHTQALQGSCILVSGENQKPNIYAHPARQSSVQK